MIKKIFTQEDIDELKILIALSKKCSNKQDRLYDKCLEVTDGDESDFVFDAVYNDFDVDKLIENLKFNKSDLLL